MSAVKKLMDVPYTEIKVDIDNHDVDEIRPRSRLSSGSCSSAIA